jgi:hypothetical protein
MRTTHALRLTREAKAWFRSPTTWMSLRGYPPCQLKTRPQPSVGTQRVCHTTVNILEVLVKLFWSLLVTSVLNAAGPVHAQERSFLTKGEVEVAYGGKTLVIERKGDGNKFRWDLKADGILYGRSLTMSGVRPTTFSGTWRVTNNGGLCVKFNDNPGEICPRSSKEGDKSVLVGRRDGQEFIFAEVLSVE